MFLMKHVEGFKSLHSNMSLVRSLSRGTLDHQLQKLENGLAPWGGYNILLKLMPSYLKLSEHVCMITC